MGLVKQIAGPPPPDTLTDRPEWHLRIRLSMQVPGEADVAGPESHGSTLWWLQSINLKNKNPLPKFISGKILPRNPDFQITLKIWPS